MLYNKANLSVAKFAGKSEAKPELTGVLFASKLTVATDGFRLVEIDVPRDVTKEEYPLKDKVMRGFKPFIANVIGVKTIPCSPNNGFVGIKHIHEEMIDFVADDIKDSVLVNKISGTFPEYESLFPKGKPVAEVTVNAKWLAEMLTVLGALHNNNEMKMKLYQKNKPLVLEAGTDRQRGRGLLMGMKE